MKSYHRDKNGKMVPCASTPCRMHGGADVVAENPTDAR